CHAPLQAGHPVTTSLGTVFQTQPRWLLDRPVNPPIKSGEGDDTRLKQLFFVMSLVLFAAMVETLPARGQEAKVGPSVTAKPGEWRYLNSDPMSTRYSPLDQIGKDNFKDLKIAWRWKPAIGPAPPSLGGTAQGNGDPRLAIYKSESTPIMANGVLYTA